MRRAQRLATKMQALADLREPGDIPAAINFLIMKLDTEGRKELRKLSAARQEAYISARWTVETIEKNFFSARNSIDVRSNYALPISTCEALREILAGATVDVSDASAVVGGGNATGGGAATASDDSSGSMCRAE